MDKSCRSECGRITARITTQTRLRSLMAAAVCVMATLLGCSAKSSGPQMYPVEGQVTFDGAPVTRGTILFRRLGGDERGYSGEITDGSYRVMAEAGPMRVVITASRQVPGKFSEVNPGEKDPVYEMYIPAAYNTKSTLEVELSAGANAQSFDLVP